MLVVIPLFTNQVWSKVGGEWCYDSDAVSPPGLMWEHWSSEGRCEAAGSLRSGIWEGSSGRLGMCLESVSSHQI